MDIEKIRGTILLISGLFNLFFAFLLWIKGKAKTTFHLGWMAFFSAVYALTFVELFLFKTNKLFWLKATWLGVLILPAYITFVYYFTEKTRYLKLKSFLWYLGAVIISYIALTTSLIIKFHSPEYPYEVTEGYGPLEPWVRIYIIVALLMGLSYLLREYFRSVGFKKLQLQYFILGIAIYVIGGFFSAGIIPLFIPATGIYADIAVIFSLPWIGLTTYAIFKKELFEIKAILTELLVGVMGVILLILPFLMPTNSLKILTVGVFLLFCFFGYLFIKSIFKEIKIKQRIGEASWKVLEQGEKVSENFKKVMGDKEKILKEWFLSDINKELEVNALRNRNKELEEKLRGK